jgi:hypothetical protein
MTKDISWLTYSRTRCIDPFCLLALKIERIESLKRFLFLLIMLVILAIGCCSYNVSFSPTSTLPIQSTPVPVSSGNNPGNGQAGSTSGETQAASVVFNQINAARAQAGLPALQ